MKKFLLLALVFALIALPMVMAAGITGRAIGDVCDVNNPCQSPAYCSGGVCIPEFTSLGMGIAIAGAGIGYALIRKK